MVMGVNRGQTTLSGKSSTIKGGSLVPTTEEFIADSTSLYGLAPRRLFLSYTFHS